MATGPTARFWSVVQGPEEELPLDEASLLIAAHAGPGLDVGAQLRRLDGLAAACPEPTLAGLRHHLFVTEGFAGDERHYYDPRNSFLDRVLDRRRGIPITLAVVMIEVGRRLGVPLAGVGMPGHFLVRHLGEPATLLDPFQGGEALDEAGARARFEALSGADVSFEAAFLDPVGPRAILSRILANLKQIYASAGDGSSLRWVLDLRSSIPGNTGDEPRQLRRLLARFN